MKIELLIVIVFTAFICLSCQKEFKCVCTNSTTGNTSYGDPIKGTVFTKKAAEESCKANNDLSAGELENCHLED
jgi:hypothetical protein